MGRSGWGCSQGGLGRFQELVNPGESGESLRFPRREEAAAFREGFFPKTYCGECCSENPQAFAFSRPGPGKPHLGLDEKGTRARNVFPLPPQPGRVWGCRLGIWRQSRVQGGGWVLRGRQVAYFIWASMFRSLQFPLKEK